MLFDVSSPFAERDACGIGFVADLHAGPSHALVDDGLTLLERLEHRGACGCDGATGDGAGTLVQLPDALFRAWAASSGVTLPPAGDYGVGVFFLPAADALRQRCLDGVRDVLASNRLSLLGVRDVPTDASVLGPVAANREPVIVQVVARRPDDVAPGRDFERRLYLARRDLERRLADVAPDADTHVPSFSSETIVYKGMLRAGQLRDYFPDLSDPSFASALMLVHARFSTNTLPRWSLAQPFRRLCHNGEINTLQGNANRMRAREAVFSDDALGVDPDRIRPVLKRDGSDSCQLDGAVDVLVHAGRPLEHALTMLVPPAWEHDDTLTPEQRAFFQYHACLTEAWDGPAAIAFADGAQVGALLDRSGLRPARYTVTHDGRVLCSSEAGVLDVPPSDVKTHGRLGPGHMIRVDVERGILETDDAVKQRLSERRPYADWLDAHLLEIEDLEAADFTRTPTPETRNGAEPDADLKRMHHAFGYTQEDLRMLLAPMANDGKTPVGSMGDDTPLAVLSDRPRLLADHFRQLFAQVTNPPLDAIRESLVTSLDVYLGAEGDLLSETPAHARRLHLPHPILTEERLDVVTSQSEDALAAARLDATMDRDASLPVALDALFAQADRALEDGATLLVLSDRDAGPQRMPVPMLLAVSGLHHHLIRSGTRTRVSLLVDSAEPREVHHVCALLGYGADAICPYGALRTIRHLAQNGVVDVTPDDALRRYRKGLRKGLLKVMSKMGISTLQSYRGAQIFEAVGLAEDVVERYFTGTPSRIGGIGLDEVASRVRALHRKAYPPRGASQDGLDVGGRVQWRRTGEKHALTPKAIADLQHATRGDEPRKEQYRQFADAVNRRNEDAGTLRGLLNLADANGHALDVDDVEPWTEIVRRFKTGAMSYGSISSETHETLAEAMNDLGGKSNTGEGGEHPERYAESHPARSRIKQIASGRFGVTLPYLMSADEIQIKMAQGAKPGEGGQLPGEKVYPWIAEVRHSTPGVPLISPPPHHDIYSIEDLAQLIFDLKNANPEARISVKLVSAAGVGTIAAGVAKARADHILISGHSGGTGASPQDSILHAGLPWEMGLSETHQMLVDQGLRNRVSLEADGGLRTGRDVAVAAMLGAEEFGFSTAPLVALGCIMMRKCHLNTCPVGIATQDPELREKFDGAPEHVVNYFYLVAQELREIMARVGVKTMDALVGRTELLTPSPAASARGLRLGALLEKRAPSDVLAPYAEQTEQEHPLEDVLDHDLIDRAEPALASGTPVTLDVALTNRNRTTGTMLSRALVDAHGEDGLPPGTITLRCTGAAGQSLGAFAAPGLAIRLTGVANDYVGKGLSGADLSIRPPEDAGYGDDAVVCGNVALYGATSGTLFVRGRAGERFAVRNSGALAVVEGVGDHGCEYMTGGCVVVLGPTGRNFAAGMSGGVAYVWDPDGTFGETRCNREMVDLDPVVPGSDDATRLFRLLQQHRDATGSPLARDLLADSDDVLRRFVKVMPQAFKAALQEMETDRRDRATPTMPTNREWAA